MSTLGSLAYVHAPRASDVVAKARAISRMLAWADAQGERILRLTVTTPRAPAAILSD